MEEITTTNLEDFKKQLQNKNDEIKIPNNNVDNKVVQVKKNIVLNVISDYAGCGHIRSILPFAYLNAVYGKSQKINCISAPFFTTQNDILVRAKTIWFQRVFSNKHIDIISQYKRFQDRFKYKMTFDVDDYIWGHNELQGGSKEDGVPSYNMGSKNIGDVDKESSIKIMNMMDQITVSSNYLGEMLKKHGVTTEIKLLKNGVNSSFWNRSNRSKITEKIKKPKFIWSGSPTHWSEAEKLKGDIDNAWCEYIIKNVKDNKIEFMQMGGVNAPFFFKELEGLPNFKTMGWLNSWQYHLPIIDYSANFSIGPLVDNNFNRSKSDIKKIEAFASNSIFIGTVFRSGKDSPYDDNFVNVFDDCTVSQIEDIVNEYSEPDKYNEMIDRQHNYMNEQGRYIESPAFVNHLTSLL